MIGSTGLVVGGGELGGWNGGIALPMVQLILLIVATAVASSIDAALAGISASRARQAIERKLPNAHTLYHWIESPGRVLVALHVLRLFFVVFSILAALQLEAMVPVPIPPYVTVTLVVVLVLALGVLVPRVIGKRFALPWACATIRVVRVLSIILLPVVWPATLLMRLVAHGVGVPAPARFSAAFWTPDEQASMSATAEAAALDGSSQDLLRSIIEFSDTVIREIMVPRTEMVGLGATASPEDVRRTVVEAGHSRIPVYEETLDQIVGILYVKDLVASPPAAAASEGEGGFNLKAYVRRTFYVPEVMKISELLREFQRRKTHMAIVVDEYGGTAGLVTLEDIIEEIVGEIQDEYDVEEKQFRVLADRKVIADGRVSLRELEEALGVEFPNGGGYETLAGFITARAGYLPQKGAVVAWNDLRFTVKEANDKRIGMVEIEHRTTDTA